MNVQQLAAKFPNWKEQYGHTYNPPASEEEVVELETLIGCVLPDDYRYFVTHVANGGSYSERSLLTVREQFEEYSDRVAKIRVRRDFPFDKSHAHLLRHEDDDRLGLPPSVWEGRQFGVDGLDGTLMFFDFGFYGDCRFVLSGDWQGRIVYNACLENISGMCFERTFVEWFVSENWLLAGE